MQENTNKAILINSIILYIKLSISSIAGLLTTRFALGALGATDFGLFSVVGGVISLIALLNTIMLSTTNRFIATAIGKNDEELINKTFNVNLIIHILIAIITILIAYPIGDWYINHYVNFDGDINLVKQVLHITIIGSVISFIGVPFNGVLVAKERFFVFSIVDILSHVLKSIGAYLLYYVSCDKLYFYANVQAVLTAVPTLVFWLYCSRNFSNICRFRIVKDARMYKEVLGFSVWVGYGAVAYIGKSQGATLIVNNFFSTIMNAALGVANSANSMIMTIGNTIGRSITPQIVKSYAAGDVERSMSLVIMSSKISFLALLLTAAPFLIEPRYLFHLWLGSVPEYAPLFIRLLIIDALISASNAGIPDLIHATGKIKTYQLIVNTISLFSIVIGYFVLKHGASVFSLFLVYISFSILVFIVRQVIIREIIVFDHRKMAKETYLPCLIVICIISPYFAIHEMLNPIISIIVFVIFIFIISFAVGLNTKERKCLVMFVHSNILKIINR